MALFSTLAFICVVIELVSFAKATLDCDGAAVTLSGNMPNIAGVDLSGAPSVLVAGICTIHGDQSVLHQCTNDDLIAHVYSNTECNGDPTDSISMCSGAAGIESCDVTCEDIPCEYIRIRSYVGVTACNADSTPADYAARGDIIYPTDYCFDAADVNEYSNGAIEYEVVNGVITLTTYGTDDCLAGTETGADGQPMPSNICYEYGSSLLATSYIYGTAEFPTVDTSGSGGQTGTGGQSGSTTTTKNPISGIPLDLTTMIIISVAVSVAATCICMVICCCCCKRRR